MSEFAKNRLAIGAASAVAGLGLAQAEGVVGFGDAVASPEVPTPNQIKTTNIGATLPKYGGTLILNNGELSPKIHYSTYGTSSKNNIGTSQNNPYPDAFSSSVKRHERYLINNVCHTPKYAYELTVSPESKQHKSTSYSSGHKFGTLTYRNKSRYNLFTVHLKNNGKHSKKKKADVCGAEVVTKSRKAYFPKFLKGSFREKINDDPAATVTVYLRPNK